MANDTIKVKFNIDPDGSGTSVLREKDQLIQEISQHFETLGQKLPLSQISQLGTLGVRALSQIKTEITGVNQALQQFSTGPVFDELVRVGGQTRSDRELVSALRAEFSALGVDLPVERFQQLGVTGARELRALFDQARLMRSELDSSSAALRGLNTLPQGGEQLLGRFDPTQVTSVVALRDELIKVGGELRSEDQLTKALQAEFSKLGVALPTSLLKEFGVAGRFELKQLLDQTRELTLQVDASSESLRKLGEVPPSKPGLGQAPLGGQFDVRSRSGLASDDFAASLAASRNGQSRPFVEENVASLSSQTHKTQDLAVANESLRGRFEAASKGSAQFGNQLKITEKALAAGADIGTSAYDKISRSIVGADKQGRVFSGTTYVGTQILRTFGVEGSRALEVVGRQFLDLGLTARDLFKSNIFKSTLAVAGGIAVGEITESITGAIRRISEFQRDVQENFVKTNRAGLTGSISEIKSDLGKLEDFQKSAQFFESQGDFSRADALRRRATAGRSSEEEIAKLQQEFSKSGSRNVGFFENFFSTGLAAQADIQKKFAELTKVQGGQASPEQVAKRIADAGAEVILFEKSLVGTGKKNIFDEANESLRRLSQSTDREVRSILRSQDPGGISKKLLEGLDPGKQSKELSDFLTGLSQKQGVVERKIETFVKDGQSGFRFADKVVERFLTPSEIKERIDLYQRGLEKNREFVNSLKQLEQDVSSEFGQENKTRKSIDQAQKSISSLRIQAEDDPLSKLIEQADKRTEEFFQRVEDFPRELQTRLQRAFRGANAGLTFRELFNLEFGEGSRDRGLEAEITRLRSGIGTNVAGITEQDRQRLLEGRIRDARESGDRDTLRTAQAGLTSREAELQEQIRQANTGRRFTQAAELENQLGAVQRETATTRLERQLRETELGVLRDRLGQTAIPTQQAFILDKILEATSKVGDLNEDQRDFRLKALQQRLSIGEAERHRVRIEIDNRAPGVTTSVEEELGPSGAAESVAIPGGIFDPLGGGR